MHPCSRPYGPRGFDAPLVVGPRPLGFYVPIPLCCVWPQAKRRRLLGALTTEQPGEGACVVEDQETKTNQDDGSEDMTIAA
jgi:hypothetical protein